MTTPVHYKWYISFKTYTKNISTVHFDIFFSKKNIHIINKTLYKILKKLWQSSNNNSNSATSRHGPPQDLILAPPLKETTFYRERILWILFSSILTCWPLNNFSSFFFNKILSYAFWSNDLDLNIISSICFAMERIHSPFYHTQKNIISFNNLKSTYYLVIFSSLFHFLWV
jgi:hypothetical protein